MKVNTGTFIKIIAFLLSNYAARTVCRIIIIVKLVIKAKHHIDMKIRILKKGNQTQENNVFMYGK